ncbi:MAG TPA: alpha-isopropylmalate synthase regulatory domain-containing protein, partial [bacterium]|nr:alpha-isopropylmalate synthase regulatory domain-containing protein [bacterium]
AVVGANAFAHEAGIHQHGVLADRRTYEIMTPESIGLPTNRLVLGKHSGRHALAAVLEGAGFHLSREELDRAYHRFKEVADRKKTVLPEEIVALVEENLAAPLRTWELRRFAVTTGSGREPFATVTLAASGVETEQTGSGDGPIDAMFAAINRVVGLSPALVDYTVRAVAGGTEAVGEAVVRIRLEHELAVGRASSTDVLEASARAYVAAINKLVAARPVAAGAGGRAWA